MRWTLNRWGIVTASVAVALLALATMAHLRLVVDSSYRTEKALARLMVRLHELDAAEWRVAAGGHLDPTARRELVERQSAARRQTDELERMLPSTREALDLRGKYDAYREAVAEEVRLLDAGDLAGARELDRRHVDPGFQALDLAAERIEEMEGRRARTALNAALAGTLLTLLLAGLAVGLLLWRYGRARRAADLALAGQQALRQSEEHFRSLVQNASDVIAVAGPTGTIQYVSPSIERLAVFTPGKLIGRNAAAFMRASVHPKDADRGRQFLARCRTQDGPCETELSVRDGRGGWHRVEVVGVNRLDDPGIRGMVFTVRDVTERREAVEALRASEERYRMLFDTSPQPMWLFDVETLAFLDVNEAAVRQYGHTHEEFLALTLRDIRPPEDVPALVAQINGTPDGAVHAAAWRHRRKDGSFFEVEIVSQRFRLGGRRVGLVLARDVTEHRRLEAELRQAQKMEAVGRLAGGVAHDFNNMMTAVLGYSEMLISKADGDAEGRHMLEEIRRAGQRATALTQRLLAFSRKHVLQPVALDLNAVVQGMAGMMRRMIGEDIQLVADLEPGLGPVRIDANGIEQVLMNLAVNSRDAMPEGGRLTIATRSMELSEPQTWGTASVAPGRYVVLSVEDTGCGMGAEIRSHLFEPFFTTKEQGKGTGLGLATVYGIVSQSAGRIHVESEAGQGTRLSILLPLCAEESARVAPVVPENQIPAGTELVLLVEDDDMVRGFACKTLTQLGYQVLEAASGREALELAERFSGPIDFLLTDVVMPQMTGRELAAALTSRRPGVKVLLTSGYHEVTTGATGNGSPGVPLLQKPFTREALARKVREVLDSA